MVNPLMSSKQEPFSGISEVLGVGPSSSTSVKLELDPSENGDEEGDTKIEVKMEALDELFANSGLFGNSIDMDSKEALIGSESLLMPLGPPPTYPGAAAGLLAPSVKTVKVPVSQMSDSVSVFPPVLSIPCSIMSSPGARAGLHIAVSPARGPDTTTLTSPPPSSGSATSIKKTIFTAKGLL